MYFVCFFMILYSIRHFWLGSRCIQEKSFTIQERWILYQHSDTIFRSPTFLASEIYTFVTCHYDVFCVFFHDIVHDSSFLTGFPLYIRKILHYARKMNPLPTFWHNFQISNMPSFWDIHVCNLFTTMYFVCFFMILYSIRHFWLGSRCIQEKSFTIQERWILSQHSDTIFRSPTFLASEIYTFVSCHYDVFCVFFHDIVLNSSFLTGFTLYTRKIVHYTRKMNPFPTFWHNFQISNMPSFWDIHVCNLSLWCILCVFSWYCARFVIFDWVPVVYKKNPSLYMKDESVPTFWHNFQIFNKPSFWDIYVCILSLRCILCVFSWYCTRFVIFDWVHVVYKKNPSLYMKDESVPTFWHNFQIFNKPSFWDIYVCILSLRCNLCVFSCYCARFVIFDCVRVVYKKNPSLYKKDESFTNILTQFSDLQHA